MPLERFRDERSLEYERALKNDELESLLVDPPTREQLARARAFGFTAMAIGMFLAIAILSTYVAALLGA